MISSLMLITTMATQKTKAVKKAKFRRTRRYTQRFNSSPSTTRRGIHRSELIEKLEPTRKWLIRQVQQDKKVWIMLCCGACRTGSKPLFADRHLGKSKLWVTSKDAALLDSALNFLEHYLMMNVGAGCYPAGTLVIPFTSPNHLVASEDNDQNRGTSQIKEIEENKTLMDNNKAETASNTARIEQENIVLKEKLVELEALVARLRFHLQKTDRGTSRPTQEAPKDAVTEKKPVELEMSRFDFIISFKADGKLVAEYRDLGLFDSIEDAYRLDAAADAKPDHMEKKPHEHSS